MGIWIILMFISLATAVEKRCPGVTFTCPESASCCLLANKSYGCCPMENAVCCDDQIHCCPANTKCAASSCIQSNNRSVEIHLLRSKDVLCDDQSVCPDDTTCCKNPYTQKVGCCPKENAVCCGDGLHCCPEGTVCDLEGKKCNGDGYVTQLYDSHKNSFNSIISTKTLSPFRNDTKFMALEKELSVICPGGQYQCPDGNVCCKVPNDGYRCCPLFHGSCCTDGLYCCPEHTHCAASSHQCYQGPRNVTSVRQIPAKKIPPSLNSIISTKTLSPLQNDKESMTLEKEWSVICPGGQYQCPDGNVCCKVPNDGYRCCPLFKGSCCTDGLYCCPEHTHCAASSHQCYQGPRNVTSVRQIPAKKIPPSLNSIISTKTLSPFRNDTKSMALEKELSVICPGGQYQCPDGNVCCKVPNDGYRCCPLFHGSCCTDGLYCCPEHTHCAASSHQCYQGPRNVTSVRQIPAKKIPPSLNSIISTKTFSPLQNDKESMKLEKEWSVICPGGQYQCPDGNVCCKVPNDGYRCCPLFHGSCCTDGLYCCPEHTHCGASSHQCYQDPRNVTSVRQIPAKRIPPSLNSIISTKTLSPFRNDTKSIALEKELSVICPGGQYQCPDGNVCCKVPNDGYRCCPLFHGSCCTDGLYCCPEHTHCAASSHQCYQGPRNVTSVRQIPAKKIPPSLNSIISTKTFSPLQNDKESMKLEKEWSVICPGGQYQCPDRNVCCKVPNDGYRCCPLFHGSCCTDGLYCCPEHTHCGASSHQCYQGPRNVTSVRQIPAKRIPPSFNSIISTKTLSPLQNDKESMTLEKEWSVICPGGQYQCPDRNVCCKVPNDGYRCCPLFQGSCCTDGLYCCPEHTHCAASSHQCYQGPRNVTSVRQIPAKRIPPSVNSTISTKTFSPLQNDKESMTLEKELSVICPGGQYQCPDGNVCCKVPNDGYRCCPLFHGSCCTDGLYCCPEHTHCGASSHQCYQGPRNVTSVLQIPAKRIPPSFNSIISTNTLSPLQNDKKSMTLEKEWSVICPGGQSQCPDGNTCCQVPNQGYRCCPFLRASCCIDGFHCCQEHMQCDPTSRYCFQGPRNVTSVRQIPAKRIPPSFKDLVEAFFNNLV